MTFTSAFQKETERLARSEAPPGTPPAQDPPPLSGEAAKQSEAPAGPGEPDGLCEPEDDYLTQSLLAISFQPPVLFILPDTEVDPEPDAAAAPEPAPFAPAPAPFAPEGREAAPAFIPAAQPANIDKDVTSVVIPAGFKVQDELRSLLARLTGTEDTNGFFALLWKHALPETFDLSAPEDMEALLSAVARALREAPPELLDIRQGFIDRLRRAAGEIGVTPQRAFAALSAAPSYAELSRLLSAAVTRVTVVYEAQPTIERPAVSEEAITPAPAAPPDAGDAPAFAPEAPAADGEAPLSAEEDTPGDTANIHSAPAAPKAAAPAPAAPAPESAEAPAPAPAPKAVMEQIARAALSGKDGGVTRLELQLQPETLGKISIVMESAADGLSAVIRPHNTDVRGALAAHVGELLNTLRDMGLNMKNISVQQPAVAWDFTRGDFSRREGASGAPHRETHRYRHAPLAPLGGMEETAARYFYGGSPLSQLSDDTAFELLA
ncbi:MAG: flagellar hook-length control protein FliK [Oscillospiraceae bacterium]|nr:flagellar hook-length control protein FliK [Oscillospiraceae bacterium]